MRLVPLQQHFRERLRKRAPWVVVLAFAAVFTGAQFLLVPSSGTRHPGVLANALLMPLLVSFCYGFITPLPWRWSGDDRARPRLLRGLVQALFFNALLITLLIALSWLMVGQASLKAEALGLAEGTKPTFRALLAMQMGVGLPLMTLVGAIISFSVITAEEKAAVEARLEEAQWVLLRGQLSPHVLFNSLNGLAELVRQDPIAAEQAILDLSELYRALLRHGDRPRAPLGEERALVRRFLAVEGLRLGGRLRVQWDWDEGLDATEAPPFLLQPLVENALKHGIAAHPDGGELAISMRRHNGGLILRVANTGRPLGLVPGAGVGLSNLEARLRLAYGTPAALHLRSEGPWTVASVWIPSLEMRR
jgi:two-component system sensor histidine kinase AlgZ